MTWLVAIIITLDYVPVIDKPILGGQKEAFCNCTSHLSLLFSLPRVSFSVLRSLENLVVCKALRIALDKE